MKIGGEFSRLISCAAIAFSGLSGAALPRPILASEANYQATLAVGDGNQEKGATCYVKDSPIVTQTPSLKEQVTIFMPPVLIMVVKVVKPVLEFLRKIPFQEHSLLIIFRPLITHRQQLLRAFLEDKLAF